MLKELLNKDVRIHYSPIEGFAAQSKGTVLEITERWLKLKSPGKKNKVNYEYINIERILRVELQE